MEYIKRDCTKTSPDMRPCPHCESCPWVGPSMSRIPRPLPDEPQMPNFHYKDVFESTAFAGDVARPPDDWQPRHNINKSSRMGL